MQGVIKVLVQKNLKFQIATEHGGKQWEIWVGDQQRVTRHTLQRLLEVHPGYIAIDHGALHITGTNA